MDVPAITQLDDGNRAPAAAGTYDAETSSEFARIDVRFSGTMFGAANPDIAGWISG